MNRARVLIGNRVDYRVGVWYYNARTGFLWPMSRLVIFCTSGEMLGDPFVYAVASYSDFGATRWTGML